MGKNTELDGAEIFENWDQLVASPTSEKKADAPSEELSFSLDSLMGESGDDHWLKQFQTTRLTDMDLVALRHLKEYTPDYKAEQAAFRLARAQFLQNVAQTHLNELRVSGLSPEQIEALSQGELPVNWTLHLKYPLAYGGVITAEHLVLISHHPFHEELHHFVDRQMITAAGVMNPPVLYMPVPKSAVYVPYNGKKMADKVVHFAPKGGDK